MRFALSSRIMPRTTIDIDAPVLKDLKRRQKLERKSLGRLVSDLLAESLARNETRELEPPEFNWISKSMGARVNLADKEAVYAAMEDERKPRKRSGGKS